MSAGYLGEIRLFTFAHIPDRWAECDGQELRIAEYQALFALLGDRFGGDGTRTFRLPDLRGRVPVSVGGQLGLGQRTGTEQHALTESQTPGHTHVLSGSADPAGTVEPAGGLPAGTGGPLKVYADPAPATPLQPMARDAVAPAGAKPHENRQPYLPLVYAICIQGYFPVR